MLYTFKTNGWFDVPHLSANARLRRKLGRELEPHEMITKKIYTEGYVSVIKLVESKPLIMYHCSRKHSVLYYKEDLAYVEAVLHKHDIKYSIFTAKTDECVQPYPAKIEETIDIALTEIQTINL